ncbi:MAG: hypothetical protein JNM88_07850 [Chitinophagaceae bacterium]|nr:hypothetical protein [Chitinophagaceae bacterium]
MQKRLLCVLFLFVCISSRAQFDTLFAKEGIRRCADSLALGFKQKNWPLFTRYSNPAMVGSLGGTELFIQYISETFSQIPDSAWKKYAPGKILQVVKTPGELQCIIELNSVIEWQGRRVTSTAALVGQSWDGGLFWTFFDSQNDAQAARMIKPDLSEALIIPAKKEKLENLSSKSKTKPATKAKAPAKTKQH